MILVAVLLVILAAALTQVAPHSGLVGLLLPVSIFVPALLQSWKVTAASLLAALLLLRGFPGGLSSFALLALLTLIVYGFGRVAPLRRGVAYLVVMPAALIAYVLLTSWSAVGSIWFTALLDALAATAMGGILLALLYGTTEEHRTRS